jgi:hypothetical protein
VAYLAALEQAPIAGEQNPLLFGRQLSKPVVIAVMLVQRVEAQKPEVDGKAPEVPIQDEASRYRRRNVYLGELLDVDRSKWGIDADSIAWLQPILKAHRDPISEDKSNLRMRGALGLNSVLDGLPWLE